MALCTCHLHIFNDVTSGVALRGMVSSETLHSESDQGKIDLAANYVDGQMVRVLLCLLLGMPFSCIYVIVAVGAIQPEVVKIRGINIPLSMSCSRSS